MTRAKAGDEVLINYAVTGSDGRIIESSIGKQPVELVAGGEGLIPQVSQALIGMEEGQTKLIETSASEAYGQRNPELEFRVPRQGIPADAEVGKPLTVRVKEQDLLLWLKERDEDSALVDANHPLAGSDEMLTFEVDLLAVRAPRDSELDPEKYIDK